MTKIDRKIVKYAVHKPEDKALGDRAAETRQPAQPGEPELVRDKHGRAAKVIRMHEKLERPEVLINSKNLDHFQWIVALTRIISAVFRKGGDVTFLVDELKAVFDPRGGYWQPGGKFMPSIIAELGYVIEKHLQTIGLIRKTQLDPHQQKMVDEKRAEYEARAKQADAFAKSHFPEGAQLCGRCSTAAVVMMDGCMTCLNCGDSKCG